MKSLNNILKHFNGDLNEWVSFLNEKINDGAEISRGKNPLEKSKDVKAKEQPSEPGDFAQNGIPPGGPSAETGAVPPIIDPAQAPGSQIAIGKKHVNAEADPESTKIKFSGEKDKINMKPTANTSFNNGLM